MGIPIKWGDNSLGKPSARVMQPGCQQRDAGATVARRSPKPQMGVRVLRILHMATTGVVAKKTDNTERYEDIKLLRVWRHATLPLPQWRGERQHHRLGIEPVRNSHIISSVIKGVKERLVKFIHIVCLPPGP